MFWKKPRDIEFGSPREKAEASIKRIDKYDSGQRFSITRSLAFQILVLVTHWAVFTAFVLFCIAVIYWFYTTDNASVWGLLGRIFESNNPYAVYTLWGLPFFASWMGSFPVKS